MNLNRLDNKTGHSKFKKKTIIFRRTDFFKRTSNSRDEDLFKYSSYLSPLVYEVAVWTLKLK